MVVNLLGRDWNTRNFTMREVHVDAAANIAAVDYLFLFFPLFYSHFQIARDLGIQNFIHISALGADATSNSLWNQTKVCFLKNFFLMEYGI